MCLKAFLLCLFIAQGAYCAKAFITSGTSWSIATDGTAIKVEAIGGGGGAGAQAGGGGGAYAVLSGIAYTSNASVTVQVGQGGASSSNGTVSKWNTSVVVADLGTSTGIGGAASQCTPTTGAFSGGAGGFTGGGGGAGGPNGVGGNGFASGGAYKGGTGDNLLGGVGGAAGIAGDNGSEFDATHGSGGGGGGGGSGVNGGSGGLYGGGGGHGVGANGAGANGLIVVTYSPPITFIPRMLIMGLPDLFAAMRLRWYNWRWIETRSYEWGWTES